MTINFVIVYLLAPPLSADEVLKAVTGVKWRRLGKELIGEVIEEMYELDDFSTNLDLIEYEYESDETRLRAVVEEFLTNSNRSWRKVIWALYCVDEVDKAQQIRSYAEPLQGVLEYDLQV